MKINCILCGKQVHDDNISDFPCSFSVGIRTDNKDDYPAFVIKGVPYCNDCAYDIEKEGYSDIAGVLKGLNDAVSNLETVCSEKEIKIQYLEKELSDETIRVAGVKQELHDAKKLITSQRNQIKRLVGASNVSSDALEQELNDAKKKISEQASYIEDLQASGFESKPEPEDQSLPEMKEHLSRMEFKMKEDLSRMQLGYRDNVSGILEIHAKDIAELKESGKAPPRVQNKVEQFVISKLEGVGTPRGVGIAPHDIQYLFILLTSGQMFRKMITKELQPESDLWTQITLPSQETLNSLSKEET